MSENSSETPDMTPGDVTYVRVYDAPRELVWECMTTPEHLTNFFGPPGISAPLEGIEVDLRPGGVFRIDMVNDATGEVYPNLGELIEVVPGERYSACEPDAADMVTTVIFNDLGDGRTEVITEQTNVPAMYRSPEAQAGMEAGFDCFADYLATLTT